MIICQPFFIGRFSQLKQPTKFSIILSFFGTELSMQILIMYIFTSVQGILICQFVVNDLLDSRSMAIL